MNDPVKSKTERAIAERDRDARNFAQATLLTVGLGFLVTCAALAVSYHYGWLIGAMVFAGVCGCLCFFAGALWVALEIRREIKKRKEAAKSK